MENINNIKKKGFHFSTEYCPAGIFEQTENIYDRLSRYNANSADVLHLLGGLAYSAGQFFDAIDFFKKAIENNPTKEDFYHDLGAAYYETGDLDKAISAFQHALCINPYSSEVNKNLGFALYLKGNLDSAIEVLHRAIAANSNATENHYTSGQMFEENCSLIKATASCQNPVDLNILDADIYLKIGNSLNALGKSNEAIGAFQNALAIDPNCTEAYLCLGNTYKMQKELGNS